MLGNNFNRILLIVPPFYRLMGGKNNWIHLGLSYIGAVLNKAGYEVKIYNADHADKGEDISLREVFEAYNQYKAIIDNQDHEIWQEISKNIKNFLPDIVGITIVLTATYKVVENIARIVKDLNPNIKVGVGGPHATLVPDETLRCNYLDYLVRGEGEYTFLELIRGRDIETIDGLSYKDEKDNIVHNKERKVIENLDELPFPDINLQLIEIKDPNEGFGVIATSRGCPLKCIFCSSPRLWGGRVRFRSVDNVIEEIKQRHYQYGVTNFYFSDDNINLNKRYAKELCRRLIDEGLNIEFSCEAKIGLFDGELVELMRKAGCKRIKLGMESGSNRILKLMEKGITVEQTRETVSLIKEAGIEYTLYALIGMPTETRQEMRQTLELTKELEPKYVSLSIATPHVGTKLYDMMIEAGRELPKENWPDYFHQSEGTILNKNVDISIIEEFLALNEKEGKARTF